jgi:O-antigen/teichoic acid export membrane protein
MHPVGRRTTDGGLTRRASLNAIAAVIEYGTRLGVGFIVNPILVAGLGGYAYGVWQVLGRLVGYMSAAGGRPSQTLKWSIANRQASTDIEEKRRQVGSSLIVAAIFLPILLPIGGVIAWFAPGWLDAGPEIVWPIRVAAGLLVADLVLLNFLAVPRSVLEGENLGYKRMGLSALLVIAWGGLTILAVKTGMGLPGVALATVVTTILTAATYFLIVRAYVPWFNVRLPARAEVRGFLGLSGWFLGWRLVMQILRSSDMVVLGIADSAELVSVYALTRYVPEALVTFVAMIVMGVAPGLGGLIGSGNLEKSAAVRAEMMSFTWVLATIAGVGILLCNRSFVGLWVGSEFYAGDIANLLIVLLVTQFVFVRNDANIIDLTLDLKKKVLLGGLAGALAVALATGFVLLGGGIVGLCAGFIIGRGFLSILYPAMVGRTLNIRPSDQVRRSLRPAVVSALLFGLAQVAGRRIALDAWLPLIGVSIATVLLVGPIAFFSGLDERGRNRLKTRAQRVAATFRGGDAA